MKKKIISLLLCVLMIVTMVPTVVMAAPGWGGKTLEQCKTAYDSKKGNFDHVDIRVAGTVNYSDGTSATVYVSNPKVKVVSDSGKELYSWSYTSGTSYEWRRTGLSVPKTATVSLTCDISDGKVTKKNQTFSWSGRDDFAYAMYICDIQSGLDFRVNVFL